MYSGRTAALVGAGRGISGSPGFDSTSPWREVLRNWWPAVLAVLAALVLVVGFIHPTAYSVPTLRAVLETIMALFALAAAALTRHQLLQTRLLRKLLLLGAVITLGLTEFLANALPAGLQLHHATGLSAGVPFGYLVVACLLVATARTSADRLIAVRRPVLAAVAISLGGCAAAELAGWALHQQLLATPSAGSGLHHALGHPLGLGVLVATAGLFVWAAAEFARQGRRELNQTWPLLGEAALLLGASRLYSLVLPWVSLESISLREGLRLVAFAFIFAAALRDDLEVRAAATHAAALAERRRVAQDLHDGLAQDLAFIAAHSAKIAEQFGVDHPVTLAARHALAVSRETISELASSNSSSLREALESIGYELGTRFEMQISVEVAPDAALSADTQLEVARIVREAVANAARHGKARHVLVSFKASPDGHVLRVVDDGRGLGRSTGPAHEGFGIRSMRDQAAALGGTLAIRTSVVTGTHLEVTFP